jgi:hypothetical protein
MAQIKITRADLEHDQVLEGADKTLLWLRTHGKLLVLVLIAIIAGYVGFGMVQNARYKKLVAANDILSEAIDRYQFALFTTEWGTPQRDEAMREVINLTQTIQTDYADTPIAREALFLQGTAHFTAGDEIVSALAGGARNTTEAITVFSRYVAEVNTPFERARGRLSLGYAYENAFFLNREAGLRADAVRTFQEVVDDTAAPDFLRAEAMLAIARLEAFQGNLDAAEQLYRRVLEMRWRPMEPLPERVGPGREMIRQLDEIAAQATLTGTARLELQRLGIDVMSEYPLVAAPTATE